LQNTTGFKWYGCQDPDWNEIADQLARQGSPILLTDPDPALGKSAKAARGVIRGWMNRKQKE
jgi:hypothetical protein